MITAELFYCEHHEDGDWGTDKPKSRDLGHTIRLLVFSGATRSAGCRRLLSIYDVFEGDNGVLEFMFAVTERRGNG